MLDNFICEYSIIEKNITLYKKVSSNESQAIYEGNNKQLWRHVIYYSEMLEKDVSVLEILPVITAEELINIIINSNNIEEYVAASLSLYHRDFDSDIKNRQLLINELGRLAVSTENIYKIKLVIYETSLYDATNKEKIVGKNITQINSDAEVYLNISLKAKKILDSLK